MPSRIILTGLIYLLKNAYNSLMKTVQTLNIGNNVR
jgi:hypothetical protein